MLMTKKTEYLFGPVPSRRLGRSLGINLVPKKICNYNCVYCEIGSTLSVTSEIKEYISIDKIFGEIEEFVKSGDAIDVITLTGAGEPTLNSGIGRLIGLIKGITSTPVAVLTNGSLLYDDRVKQRLFDADIVIPSVDSVVKSDFLKVDRSGNGDIDIILNGIRNFSNIYNGRLWLEGLIVKNINDSLESIKQLGKWASTVKAEKLQIGSVVRPPAADVMTAVASELQRIAGILRGYLNYAVEVAGEFEADGEEDRISEARILSSCRMRPLTKNDLTLLYGDNPKLHGMLCRLIDDGLIKREKFDGRKYYKTTNP